MMNGDIILEAPCQCQQFKHS